jgi:hypothetical protein
MFARVFRLKGLLMNVFDLQTGSPVWAMCPGLGWQAAIVRRVGRRRGDRTTVTIAFQTGHAIAGTRTPPYLWKRDVTKLGTDQPAEQLSSWLHS